MIMSCKIYTFSYDLSADTADYEAVYNVIKQYDHCRCLESTWLIASDKSAKELSDSFEKVLKDGDRYIIYPFCAEDYWGSVYKRYGTWEWIREKVNKK